MATLASYRTEIAAILGLDNSVSGDQPRIDDFVNEGIAQVLVQTGCRVRAFTMTTTAATADYTLSTTILSIVDLAMASSSSSDYLMDRVSPAELLALRRNGGTSSDSPPRKFAVAGADLLMLWPTPAGVDTLSGIYVPRPATLANSGDTPSEIPAEWHRVPAYYALFRLADMDDDASSQQGEHYRSLFEQAILQMRAHLHKRGGNRLGQARLNPRRGPRVPSDPSVSFSW